MIPMPRNPIAALAAALVLAACTPAESPLPKWPVDMAIAETINGEPVPELMLELVARERKLDLAVPEQREQAVSELREYVVLDQVARKNDYSRDPKFLAATELYRLQGVAEAARVKLGEGASVDDAALRAEFDRQVELAGPSAYDISQLVFDNEDDALKATGEATTKPFEQVFDAWRSKARQAQNFAGVRPAQLPEALGKALAALSAGETTRLPVQLGEHWIVVHATAVKPVTPPPFEQVKDAVRATVLSNYAEQQVRKFLGEAKVEMKTPPAAKK
ncbi:MAG: peptidyl-prolyl cis-trans isomerase [Xanthomonadales bacterium]|nr:peptidyl-prolyl cis-trans isomerase [Xanthomonadales bacterium]